jgi:hypothetical protein
MRRTARSAIRFTTSRPAPVRGGSRTTREPLVIHANTRRKVTQLVRRDHAFHAKRRMAANDTGEKRVPKPLVRDPAALNGHAVAEAAARQPAVVMVTVTLRPACLAATFTHCPLLETRPFLTVTR